MRVEASGLTKRYGRVVALEDVSFQAEGGTALAVVGPSGSGKSTLLRMVAGLERPTRGRVRVGGKRPDPRRIGHIPQRDDLDPGGPALEAVVSGRGDPHVRERARSLLGRLGVRSGTPVRELSLGDRRRVLVARTLVTGPWLLLADEPTANLDPEGATELADLLLGTVETGTLLLLATHDEELARRCGAALRLGR